MFVTNWISTTKIQKISEITNFFRHYFLSRTEVEAISVLRNIIAHHSRIWYKIFSKKPTNISHHRNEWMHSNLTEHQRKRAFGVISCLLYLCNAICPNNTIKKDIKELFASYPNIPIFMIGFTRAWEENPIWK